MTTLLGAPFTAALFATEIAYGDRIILACGLTYLLTLRLRIYEAQHMSPTPSADEAA